MPLVSPPSPGPRRAGGAIATVLAITAAAPASPAQEVVATTKEHAVLAAATGGPAVELAKLDGLLGTWRGGGRVRTAADAPPIRWQAQLTYGRVLDGHFVHEDMRVEFAGEAMPPLQMRRFYGFDRETRRWVGFGIDNMGTVEAQEVFVLGGNVMVTMSTSVDEAGPSVERGTVRWNDGRIEVTIERGEGASGFYTHVQGAFERAGDEPAPVPAVEAAFMAQPHAEMRKLQGVAGAYRIEGRMRRLPEADWVPVHGTGEARLMWSGTVLEDHVRGEATTAGSNAFEGLGYTTWSPRERAYVHVWLENDGAAVFSKARWVDGVLLVFTSETVLNGLPAVGRHVMEIDAAGAYARCTADTMAGKHEATRSFEAKYTRLDGSAADTRK